ncbi:MAG: polyphosphate kinase 2 family protein [Planctomycetota bacterium]
MRSLKAIEHLRVKPGDKAGLAKIDPDFCGDLTKEDAEGQLAEDLEALGHLQQQLYAEDRRALLVVLQGIDTAGKDGVIRKVMTGFNPQGCVVTPFKKPAGEELEHDYLWRVHAACPRRGEIGVFNRSHYEDVLVVRVHDLVHGKRLERRYDTINNFERMLDDEGTHVVKFFLWISRDEQRRRLQDRLQDPEKNWKFSEADLKERERWDEYMEAFELALTRCSTDHAPWWIVPANRKWFRNWMVARVLRHTLESFDMKWPKAKIDVSKVRVA